MTYDSIISEMTHCMMCWVQC